MKNPIIAGSLLSAAVGLLALGIWPSATQAYTFANYCCGDVDFKDDGPLQETRNLCSVPDGSRQADSYFRGIAHWARYSNDFITAAFVRPRSDCNIDLSDGNNETALVPRSSISGLNGLTTYAHVNVCVCGNGGNYGATDSRLADDSDFSKTDGQHLLSNAIGAVGGGRADFIHEIGHQFGLDHQPGFDMMETLSGYPVSGDLDSRPQPLADDAAGVNALYHFTPALNIFTSAQRGNADGNPSPFFVCQSGTITMRGTIVNPSNSSTSYHQFVYLALNADDPPTAPGVIRLGSFTSRVSARSVGTITVNASGPFPAGAFFMMHAVDDNNALSETNERDNISTEGSVIIFGGC
jgi:hypothetical protein